MPEPNDKPPAPGTAAHPGRKPDALLEDLNPESVADEIVQAACAFVAERVRHLQSVQGLFEPPYRLLAQMQPEHSEAHAAPHVRAELRTMTLWQWARGLVEYAQTGRRSVDVAQALPLVIQAVQGTDCPDWFAYGSRTPDAWIALRAAGVRWDIDNATDYCGAIPGDLFLLGSFASGLNRSECPDIDASGPEVRAWLAAKGVPGFSAETKGDSTP